MPSQSERTIYSPSLLWVLPIACSIWLGLIVEGWWAHATMDNRILSAGDSILEAMTAPAILVLLVWLVFTTVRWSTRLLVLGFLISTSLPIAYLSFQQPGQEFTSIWDPVQHYTRRIFFRELLSQTWFDLVITLASAMAIMMAFNRWMTRIVFHRVPIAPKAGAKPSRSDRYYAFWGPTPLEDPQLEQTHLRNEWRLWWILGAVLLVGCGWNISVGTLLKFHSTLLNGLGIAISSYLLIWVASHFYRPWWTCLCLAVGVGLVPVLAQLIEITWSLGPRSLGSELVVWGAAAITSVVLVTLSLMLLLFSHQMPRRCRKRIDGWTPVDYFSNDVQKRSSIVRFWLVTLPVFALFCGFALWLPTHLAPLELTIENELSFRNSWLAAKILRHSGGNRQIFSLRGIGKKTTFLLKLPRLADEWEIYAQLMERRAIEGGACSIRVREDVDNLEYLQKLLDQGIQVNCSLDAKQAKVPTHLVETKGLQLMGLSNAVIDAEGWASLEACHPMLRSFGKCRLADPIPGNMSYAAAQFMECEISPEGFAQLSARAAPFKLYETHFSGPVDGYDLFRFLYFRGSVGGRIPISNLAEGFPRVFVPVYVSDLFSKWEISTRRMLTDAEVLAEVLETKWSIPPYFVLDSQGRLTKLGVKPTRDCPKNVPWIVQPDVEELFLDLSAGDFDSRTDEDAVFEQEEIGFQSAAFPKLSSIFIQRLRDTGPRLPNDEPRDPRLDGFLKELLSDPKVAQVKADIPSLHDNWKLLLMHGKVERLVIVRKSGDGWNAYTLAQLPALKTVQKVIVVDGSVFADGKVNEFGLSTEEIGKANVVAEQLVKWNKEVAEKQWLEIMRGFAPNATVEIVAPEKPVFNFSKPFGNVRKSIFYDGEG